MQSYTPNYNSRYSNTSQPESSYEDIISEILSLDRQNKKLLAIADNIMKTSFMRQHEQTPAVVMQLEEDMKNSFNALIESIREFFMSIDAKVKELGQIIELRINEQEQGKNYHNFLSSSKKDNTPTNQATIDNLVTRIAYMQQNIKRSQQNEAKLITIIEQMNNRKMEDQPTIRKESEKMNIFAAKVNQIDQNSQEQGSFRLFSMGQMNQGQQRRTGERKQDGQVYQRFQQYSNHPVVESIDPSSHRRVKEAPGFFCGPPMQDKLTQNRGLNYIKNSTNQFQFQSSNRVHRLSNLLKALKQ